MYHKLNLDGKCFLVYSLTVCFHIHTTHSCTYPIYIQYYIAHLQPHNYTLPILHLSIFWSTSFFIHLDLLDGGKFERFSVEVGELFSAKILLGLICTVFLGMLGESVLLGEYKSGIGLVVSLSKSSFLQADKNSVADKSWNFCDISVLKDSKFFNGWNILPFSHLNWGNNKNLS